MVKTGFTLIEMSIVLVIIGLIVGGVLVGQDLIRAAEIRAVVKQYESFNTAVNTFKNKYNCLPGDCDHAYDLGLGPTMTVADNGNGDGIIGDDSDPSVDEVQNFWLQLTSANLISTTMIPTTDQTGSYPQLAMRTSDSNGQGLWWIGFGVDFGSSPPITGFTYNDNVFQITPGDPDSPHVGTPCLDTLEARAIDSKIDDGLPSSGIVLAVENGGGDHDGAHLAGDEEAPSFGYCVSAFNLYGPTGNYCSLVLRSQFSD